MRSPEEEVRITELRTCGKTDLASHYRNISGHVGSPIPPERWSRDDLINEIIRAEFAPSPTGAVTNPVPQADAGRRTVVPSHAPKPQGAVMTDIKAEDVKVGQRVRLRHDDGFAEGLVTTITPSGYINMLDVFWAPGMTTRVELLSEPVPKWPVGTLAEIDWTGHGGLEHVGTLAWRESYGWRAIPAAMYISDDYCSVTAVRPMKLVPADAVVIGRDLAEDTIATLRTCAEIVREDGLPISARSIAGRADDLAALLAAQGTA